MIDFQTKRSFGKVSVWKAGVVGEFHFRFMERGVFVVLKRCNGSFKKFAIKMKSDGSDVT